MLVLRAVNESRDSLGATGRLSAYVCSALGFQSPQAVGVLKNKQSGFLKYQHFFFLLKNYALFF